MTKKQRETMCVECRSTERRIIRRYNGHAFCSTCYAREFKNKPCPKCKKVARLPRFNDKAVCRSCETDKPCIRCGKENYKAGKITDNGPVCASCSVYFREVKICPSCGDESQALSKSKHLDHDLAVCQKCQRSVHKTCKLCRRYRLVTIVNGDPICKKCLNNDLSQCSSCHKDIPAGRGTECEECFHRRRLYEKTKHNLSDITSHQLKDIFKEYSVWLQNNINLQKASMAIDSDFALFKKLDTIWGYLPSYAVLLEYFDPEGLRHNLRVIRFLDAEQYIKIDESLKKEHSEKHQIKRLLISVEDNSWAEAAINGYHEQQLEKLSQQKTSFRSIRLSLSASIDLLKQNQSTKKALSQKEIDAFLIMKPGQRANITGFINYLNREYGLDLSNNINRIVKNKKYLQKMLINMMLDQKESKAIDQSLWIKVSLAYYHDLLISHSANIDTTNNPDGSFTILYKKESYYIPGIDQHLKNHDETSL